MIERFNFYDVYGYLVPGVALFLVLSIPYFAAGAAFPFDDLADADFLALNDGERGDRK